MNTNKYGLEVLINGTSGKKSIAKLSHNGKLFIEAKDGTEYLLRVSNNTNKRVMAVVSVDGINVVDGSKADFDGPGYVVNAFSSVEIKGFRESLTEVGNFKFAIKGKGYNSNPSSNGDVACSGTIGCIFVEEKEDATKKMLKQLQDRLQQMENQKTEHHHHHYNWWWNDRLNFYEPYYPTLYRSTTTVGDNITYTGSVSNDAQAQIYSCCVNADIGLGAGAGPQGPQGAQGSCRGLDSGIKKSFVSPGVSINEIDRSEKVPEFDLATAWGQRSYDKVEMVEFERGAIVEQIRIYYATREVLVEAGVPVVQKKAVAFPDAFPGQFCKPPVNH